MMVANKGLEKAEPIEPGPPGLTALHPLRRMRCEIFQVKQHTYKGRAESTPRRAPMAKVGLELAAF